MNEHALATKTKLEKKKQRLLAREQIIDAIRAYFKAHGFLEVSTPIRIHSPAPELNIDPEPSGNHFLIASPELQMKRLVAAGYDKIFQIEKCFRQEERGHRHLPEFTMLEWYETAADMDLLKTHCKGLIQAAAQAVNQYPSITYGTTQIDIASPWQHIEVQDAFKKYAGWIPGPNPDELRFDMDLVDKVEPSLPTHLPVFLVGYPAGMASLAKIDKTNKNRALRLELYMAGIELANGFEELTCPTEQRRRFIEEENQRRQLGKIPYPLDEDFLQSLELGLPECAGMALGIDRLVMLLTQALHIEDVVAFT